MSSKDVDTSSEDAGWRNEGGDENKVVNFGRGQPHPSLFPAVSFFTDSLNQSASKYGMDRLLQYGSRQGTMAFRRALAQFLQSELACDPVVDPDCLFVTGGGSMALEFCVSHLSSPGDICLVEEPVYWLAVNTLKQCHLKLVGVPVREKKQRSSNTTSSSNNGELPDDGGIDVDEVERLLVEEGLRPRFLYCVPTHQNPTGRTMATDQRQRLVELARRFRFIILSDDVYDMLYWPGQTEEKSVPPRPLLLHYDNGDSPSADSSVGDCDAERPFGVISIGTFSKLLAPGLRLGWLQVHPSQKDRLLGPLRQAGVVNSGGCLNQFVAQMLTPALENGLVRDHLAWARRRYKELCHTMCQQLRQRLPAGAVEFDEPRGGYFVWLRLVAGGSPYTSADQLLAKCRDRVLFKPGSFFQCHSTTPDAPGRYAHCLRLSFAHQTEQDIEEGVRRLASFF